MHNSLPSNGRPWTMVVILSLLFVVSMVDRFALGMLVEPIKRDLGVTDVQLGLLFGSAFAIFFGVVTIPMARLADRRNRVRLIILAALTWSTCTMLSSMATSFAVLLVLRVGLAIGEAALTPAAYSLIGDALPPHRRTLGGAVFNAFGMAGAAGAYIMTAGVIEVTHNLQAAGYLSDFRIWQAVLIIIGAPGAVLTLLFVLMVREPPRTAQPDHIEARSLADVLRYAWSQGWLYIGLFLGFGCIQLATNGFLGWAPTYLSRGFGMPIAEAGRLYGTYNLFAFISGSLAIPVLGVWVGRRRRDGIVLIGVVSAILSAAFCVAASMQDTANGFLVCSFIGLFMSVGAASHGITSLHLYVPPAMRATMIAFMLICLTTVSLGVAPPAVAALAGWFGSGNRALGVGLGMVAGGGGVLSALFLLSARKRLITYPTGHGEVGGAALGSFAPGAHP